MSRKVQVQVLIISIRNSQADSLACFFILKDHTYDAKTKVLFMLGRINLLVNLKLRFSLRSSLRLALKIGLIFKDTTSCEWICWWVSNWDYQDTFFYDKPPSKCPIINPKCPIKLSIGFVMAVVLQRLLERLKINEPIKRWNWAWLNWLISDLIP